MERISERKQIILRALIDSYIVSAEPISSSDIKKKCLPNVSSATIRSDLVSLDEMGYLLQPHVSAGRIPSSKAYRYYVDNLMEQDVDNVDIIGLRTYFDKKLSEVEEVVRNTAKIISDATNYTSIFKPSSVEKVVINEIKLVDIGMDTALVIIITDSGVLKDKMINLPAKIGEKYFITANNMLNDLFAGKSVGEIGNNDKLIFNEIDDFKNIFEEVISMITSYRKSRNEQVYLEGTEKIFEYKEYENIENIKNFLSVIGTKEKIKNLLSADQNIEISIRIGKDEFGQENLAIVTARCMVGGKEIGRAGVIGPERMDYKKVIAVLENLTKAIDRIKE